MENIGKYNIRAVCKITGIGEHTIRAWERRYNAIVPERTETNRRLYSNFDIKKLSLLSKAVKDGHAIGNIANYDIDKLEEILNLKTENLEEATEVEDISSPELINHCIDLIINFERQAIENILIKSSIENSKHKMLIDFIIPLLEKIGFLWEKGTIRVFHEHFAVSIIRTFLGNLVENNKVHKNAPKIITTTPEGFLHELGALIAALYAMDFGWDAIFLGPNLPPEEIVAAVNENKAKVVLLSMVYPNDDPNAGNQLRKLRKYLGDDFPIIISGRSAPSYSKYINETNSMLIKYLDELKIKLDKIRNLNYLSEK